MRANRKELKFIVGKDILLDVRNRINPLMKKDPHQQGDFYRIRSLYFDSPDHRCFRENKAGVSPREKYRIRIYNCAPDPVMAEIKQRHRDTITKKSALIDRSFFERLIKSSPADSVNALEEAALSCGQEEAKAVLEKYMEHVANEFYLPACIVDYERSAYVYDICNVRITFDTNIMGSCEFDRMFDHTLTGRAALDGDMHVLEIKYDEFLPDEIAGVLGGLGLSRSSCSKYALCMERMGIDI